jgi:hypothetical protein
MGGEEIWGQMIVAQLGFMSNEKATDPMSIWDIVLSFQCIIGMDPEAVSCERILRVPYTRLRLSLAASLDYSAACLT